MNVFQYITENRDCEEYEPDPDGEPKPTEAPPGTQEKIDILRKRMENGEPLWHENDRTDYSGLRSWKPAARNGGEK